MGRRLPSFLSLIRIPEHSPDALLVECDTEVLKLYQLPFWADEGVVTTMALDFESNGRGLEGNRRYVRYATATKESGKTVCILLAFRNSAEGNRSIDGICVPIMSHLSSV